MCVTNVRLLYTQTDQGPLEPTETAAFKLIHPSVPGSSPGGPLDSTQRYTRVTAHELRGAVKRLQFARSGGRTQPRSKVHSGGGTCTDINDPQDLPTSHPYRFGEDRQL